MGECNFAVYKYLIFRSRTSFRVMRHVKCLLEDVNQLQDWRHKTLPGLLNIKDETIFFKRVC